MPTWSPLITPPLITPVDRFPVSIPIPGPICIDHFCFSLSKQHPDSTSTASGALQSPPAIISPPANPTARTGISSPTTSLATTSALSATSTPAPAWTSSLGTLPTTVHAFPPPPSPPPRTTISSSNHLSSMTKVSETSESSSSNTQTTPCTSSASTPVSTDGVSATLSMTLLPGVPSSPPSPGKPIDGGTSGSGAMPHRHVSRAVVAASVACATLVVVAALGVALYVWTRRRRCARQYPLRYTSYPKNAGPIPPSPTRSIDPLLTILRASMSTTARSVSTATSMSTRPSTAPSSAAFDSTRAHIESAIPSLAPPASVLLPHLPRAPSSVVADDECEVAGAASGHALRERDEHHSCPSPTSPPPSFRSLRQPRNHEMQVSQGVDSTGAPGARLLHLTLPWDVGQRMLGMMEESQRRTDTVGAQGSEPPPAYQ
ncbi:hypothetical protein BC628DRAFT_138209 [Trametes gibbosa]|nr:hypothetical protein BC628DRAFT_138209 [Trametes gibbosa]